MKREVGKENWQPQRLIRQINFRKRTYTNTEDLRVSTILEGHHVTTVICTPLV